MLADDAVGARFASLEEHEVQDAADYEATRRLLTEQEKAEFLMMASFGPSRASLAAMGSSTIEDYISEQFQETPTLHRSFYRARVNSRAGNTNVSALARGVCESGSRWLKFALSRRDEGLHFKIANNVLTVDGEFRTNLDPSLTGNGLDAALAPGEGYICRVDESVGGQVEFQNSKPSSSCRSNVKFANPALWITDSSKSTTTSLAFVPGPKPGVVLLDQTATPCTLDKTYVKVGGEYFMHDPRMALLDNLVDNPSVGPSAEPYFFVVPSPADRRCRPLGDDIKKEKDCQSAAQSTGRTYKESMYDHTKPAGCISDGSDVWYNRHWNGGEDASFQLICRLPCPVVEPNLFNKAYCRVVSACGGTKSIACGSPGETANVPALGHRYGFWYLDDHNQNENDMKRDPAYAKDFGYGLDRHVVWTTIAMQGKDQLCQRTAWAMAQIFVTSVKGFGYEWYSEMWFNYYDIFVSNCFGSFKDILLQVTYNPIMGQYLTYDESKSFDADGKYPDENYAREVMQLFTIGQWMLNLDGTIITANGQPVLTYDNEDIMNFARVFTGFAQQSTRGNYERTGWRNQIDPMRIRPEHHDVYPKPDLFDNYLGDVYPLCVDLPPRSFLKEGATYEFVGHEYTGDADVLEVVAGTELYVALSSVEMIKVLPSTLACSGVQCELVTVNVVKVGTAFYEYQRSTCVHMFHTNSRVVQQSSGRFGDLRYSKCANPYMREASTACCTPEGTFIAEGYANSEYVTLATAESRCALQGMTVCGNSGPSTAATGDDTGITDVWTPESCGMSVAVDASGRVASQVNGKTKENWYMAKWEQGNFPSPSSCPTECQGLRVLATSGTLTAPFKVTDDYVELPEMAVDPTDLGKIKFDMHCTTDASVAFEVYMIAPNHHSDSFKVQIDDGDKQDWHTNTGSEWFWSSTSPGFEVPAGAHKVIFHGREDGLLVKKVQLSRGVGSCTIAGTPETDSCICHGHVEERSVFDHIPSPQDLRQRLFVGALAPRGSVPYHTSGAVKAYYAENVADMTTVFEYEGRFYKNMESLVHVASFTFRNAPVFMNPTQPTVRAVNAEVEALVDHLVEHPNTPVFIAYRLIQRLVTSNPSGEHVKAVAEAFSKGAYGGKVYSGKRGDLMAAVAAVLLHPSTEAAPLSLLSTASRNKASKASSKRRKQDSSKAQDGSKLHERALFSTQIRKVGSCSNTRRNPPELSRSYSSAWGDHQPGDAHARSMLYSPLGWAAKSNSVGQWMQIDLDAAEEVSGVATQGRSQGNWLQRVTSFKVSVSMDGATWTEIDGTFTGNTDQETVVENLFPAPVMAKSVRIYPQTWNQHITMRAGLLVCAPAACSEQDVQLTNVQGTRGTPEIFFQGEFRPICSTGWWGDGETKLFCRALGAVDGTLTRTNWIYDADGVEARDWQLIHDVGLTTACRAGTKTSMEIECTGGSMQLSTCSVAPMPTPAPAPVPDTELQIEVQTAGRDFGWPGLSAFYLNGVDLEGPNSRGFNVITLSTTGEVITRSTWDVMFSRDDVKAFVNLIHKTPFGTRVIISVKERGPILPSGGDEWTLYVTAATEEVLTSLGATQFTNLDEDMPYALIAQVGFPMEAREIIGEKDDNRLLSLEATFPKQPMPVPPASSGTEQCKNWDVRLSGVIKNRGIPEVFLSGTWHPICRHYFENTQATELCKKLGADGGVRHNNVRLGYDKDAVEIRTWGEVYKEGLTSWCEKGRDVSLWVECTGHLSYESSCAAADVQECSYNPIPSAECPCEHGNHGSCDLPECGLGISPGELCEADGVLPDGREEWDVNNCAEHFDLFRYECGTAAPPAPAPAPTGDLCFEVKSSAYNAGFSGQSEFTLNGADLEGPNQAGINLVVVSPAGQVQDKKNFNLNNWDKPSKAVTVAAFVASLEVIADGDFILLSVKDNAFTWYQEDVVKDAVAGLGSKRISAWHYRTPFALIVRKGHPNEGVHEGLDATRSHKVITVNGCFSETLAPTPAPTPAPAPTSPPALVPVHSLPSDARKFGKLREPVLKLMHFLRAMEYEEADPDRELLFDTLEYEIGQWMYMSPSVFNFYKPEYHPANFNASLVAPEFEIFTPPYAVGFLNGMVELINFGLSSCNGGFGETSFSCSEAQGKLAYGRAGTVQKALDELDVLLTAGRLSGAPEADIVKSAYESAPEGEKLKAAQKAILFTPQFNTLGDTLPRGTMPPSEEATQETPTLQPYKAVVKLFFHGGMDSFNMLVPLENPLLKEYQEVRSDIQVPQSTLEQITTDGQAISKFGIHPALPELRKLYDDKHAAFVTNIGGLVEPITKTQFFRGEGKRCMGLFSHSDQILGAQTLQCQNGNSASRGAGGRLGDSLAENFRTSSFSVSGAAAWSQGFETHTEILDRFSGAVRLKEYESLKTVVGNITQVKHGQIYSDEFVQQLGRAVKDSEELGEFLEGATLHASWNTGYSLSLQLQQVSKVIKSKDARNAERDLFFVGIGGFDHHNEVINALTGRFSEINSAIKSFVAELKEMNMFNNVVLMTASDFGRTLTSNGAGSDHGWAGQHFIIGGSVKGGKIYNQFPESLKEGNSQDAGRGRLIPKYPWESMELPVAQWMGLDPADQAEVFPNLHNFNSTLLISSSSLFQ